MNLRYKIMLEKFQEELGLNLRWVYGWEGIYCISSNGILFKKDKYIAVLKKAYIKNDGLENAIAVLKDPFGVKSNQTVSKDKMMYEAFIKPIGKEYTVKRVINKHNDININEENFKIVSQRTIDGRYVVYYDEDNNRHVWSSINKAATALGLDVRIIRDSLQNKPNSILNLSYGV
ncbi:hypothetical protein [Liquorilactobacillus hordei]|uniref:Uncharacterized protein n=1 Tax=Liquorilactobacillus hordei DSM 19519 TaxID=1423759 RepID=A0A0R1MSA6_9LACO|nr:hypothetical protein [Liquorilactobacillus hordei]KRL08021.1 hypothetical protein FC92_GL001094 [Liquorilactobacillus hordei DSM 19519]QYH51032.1 hypothetical protein G6O70_00265 [Liquorilactobacillus hordei DSM 19519]